VTGDRGTSDPKRGNDAYDRLWRQLVGIAANGGFVPVDPFIGAGGDLTWRSIDAELAELASDSDIEGASAAATRGFQDSRLLTFEARSLTVEVEVTALGGRRRLVGQLVPPQRGGVLVRHQDGIAAVEVDELGQFRVEDLPAGPSSLRCHTGRDARGGPVVTDWVSL
jgi:hypothetical protein